MEHKDTEQKYDLYTEKIVLSPKVKYKNLIRTIKILILIIIAGVVYIAADKLIVPSVKAKFDKKKAEQDRSDDCDENGYGDGEQIFNDGRSQGRFEAEQDRIEFTRDEYPEPVVVEDEEGQPQIKKDYDTLMQSLRTKVDDVQKSVVIIQESTEGLNYENYIENRENVTSTAGLIVAYVNSRYIILTSKKYTDNTADISVKVNDNEYKAVYVCSDSNTGISIISVDAEQMSEDDRTSIEVSVLSNSYILNKGELVIAAGNIYGTDGAVDYGTITNISSYSLIDNNVDIFETNLTAKDEDYAFLFNSDGNVVGISVHSNKDVKLKFMGISDLKGTIENMINRQEIMYFGIKAENVDNELADKYSLTTGIYILAVEQESPAYQAGLQTGDVIVEVNGEECLTMQKLNEKLYRCQSGQSVNVLVKRLGKSGYFEVSYDVNVEYR